MLSEKRMAHYKAEHQKDNLTLLGLTFIVGCCAGATITLAIIEAAS